jgi:dihydroorotate dehydrogenase (NAD+) catalytic subunit
LPCAWSIKSITPDSASPSAESGVFRPASTPSSSFSGASTVQVGTQNFIDPASAERIVREVEEFCRQNSVTDLREIVGALKTTP